jgi:hypothetical protein
MSLDIELIGEKSPVACVCLACGDSHTRQEGKTYFFGNITHNLNKMAEAAGLYKALWHPEELRISHANYIIETLTIGLARLKSDPSMFKAMNPINKWGDYDSFVGFVEKYLAACKMYPEARIEISR